MKSFIKLYKLEKGFFQFVLLSAIVCLTCCNLPGQHRHDFLLPSKGKAMLSVNSGIPYVGIAELSYGITDRFALGLVAGHTTVLPGYGLRVKMVMDTTPNRRINLKMPVLYYPFTRELGGDPWILAWPTLNMEWQLKNGSRFWMGIGVVGAACVDYLFGTEEQQSGDENHEEMKKEMVMADLWNTIQFAYAKPLSERLSFMVEIAPVFKGFELANPHNWIGGPPVLLSFGLSRSL